MEEAKCSPRWTAGRRGSAAALCVAGAVLGDSVAALCVAGAVRRDLWLLFAWQAQYAESTGGLAGRLVAAGPTQLTHST